jgi:hypothetical protein
MSSVKNILAPFYWDHFGPGFLLNLIENFLTIEFTQNIFGIDLALSTSC